MAAEKLIASQIPMLLSLRLSLRWEVSPLWRVVLVSMRDFQKNRYNFYKYDHKGRWMSYWYQIQEVLDLPQKQVLEVGIGNKTVSNYLKNQGANVKTLDNNPELNPDIISSVIKLPFPDNSFDVVLSAQVLEHLPFDQFEDCLSELKRITEKYLVLSLPHFGPSIKLSFKFPLIREKRIAYKIYWPKKHKFNGEHYWEIGKKGYEITKIKNIIKKYFKIKKEFLPFENQYHHFFVLEK